MSAETFPDQDPTIETPTWKSRAWKHTKRAAAFAGRETKRAATVAGRAIAQEGAKELFARANESQQRPASLNPERRGAKATFIDVVTWAGPIAVRAVVADIHSRIMNPAPEQPTGNMGANTPFEAPNQARPAHDYTPGPEGARAAGQAGFAGAGPRIKV